MNKTVMLVTLCMVALANAAEPPRAVCLPEWTVVGLPADAQLTLLQTNAPSHAVRPVAVHVLITANRNTAVTATYEAAGISYADVQRAVTAFLGREPDTENANSAYWVVKTDGQSQVTASVSHQSHRIKMAFAEHPVMNNEEANPEPAPRPLPASAAAEDGSR